MLNTIMKIQFSGIGCKRKLKIVCRKRDNRFNILHISYRGNLTKSRKVNASVIFMRFYTAMMDFIVTRSAADTKLKKKKRKLKNLISY